MTSEYFDDRRGVEKRGSPAAEKWLKEQCDLNTLEYIGDQPDGIKEDKDYVGYTQDGKRHVFELKVRSGRFRTVDDILIEIVSNDKTGAKGWIWVSKADWLVYVFLLRDRLDRGFIFNMAKLREWFAENQDLYPTNVAPNPPENPEYQTHFKLVPIDDIPREIAFKHSVTDGLEPRPEKPSDKLESFM